MKFKYLRTSWIKLVTFLHYCLSCGSPSETSGLVISWKTCKVLENLFFEILLAIFYFLIVFKWKCKCKSECIFILSKYKKFRFCRCDQRGYYSRCNDWTIAETRTRKNFCCRKNIYISRARKCVDESSWLINFLVFVKRYKWLANRGVHVPRMLALAEGFRGSLALFGDFCLFLWALAPFRSQWPVLISSINHVGWV